MVDPARSLKGAKSQAGPGLAASCKLGGMNQRGGCRDEFLLAPMEGARSGRMRGQRAAMEHDLGLPLPMGEVTRAVVVKARAVVLQQRSVFKCQLVASS